MTGRSILVSGASSGIGEATVRRFASAGWRVFAGVRSDADAARLREVDGVRAVRLEVTQDASVEAAIAEVAAETGDRGLDVLVNNAGIVRAGPVEYLGLDEWYSQFEVNLFGVVRLTKAAFPLLRLAVDPRIVMVGSINSRVGAPLVGPYAASKHAMAGLVASMRRELGPGAPIVTLLEPGAVKTAIWPKAVATADRLEAELPSEALVRYRDHIDAQRVHLAGGDHAGIDPDAVAQVIEAQVGTARPPARKLIGRDARLGGALDRFVPSRWFEALASAVHRRALRQRSG